MKKPLYIALCRTVCILLIALMGMTLLASCKKDNDDPKDDNSSGVLDEVSENSQNSGGEDLSEMPTPIMDDFDGYEFRVLTRKGSWESSDITAESLGNTVDQAVFYRNEFLNSKYNFKIVETKDNKWVQTANLQGSSGMHQYDMFSVKMNDVSDMSMLGYVYDLNDVEGMNLDASYYDQNLRTHGSYVNHCFFLVGDMLTNDEMATGVFFINHMLWDKLKLSDTFDGKTIYEIVEGGGWTFETLKKCCTLAKFDVDGDGLWEETDQWGFKRDGWMVISMNIGMGNSLLQKDADDLFYLNDSTKQVNDMQRIVDFLRSDIVAQEYQFNNFKRDNNMLFIETQMREIVGISASGMNYGVLPYPKNDAYQTEYVTFISTYGSNCISIASTVASGDHLNKVANIIELTSYESQRIVTPKLNEYLFEGRLYNHVEDHDMLNILFSNRRYELSYLWRSVGDVYNNCKAMVETDSENSNVASTLAILRPIVEEAVKSDYEKLKK